MGTVIIFVAGALVTAVFLVLIYQATSKKRDTVRGAMKQLEDEMAKRAAIRDSIKEIFASLVPVDSLRKIADEIVVAQESLKAERGRIMITQAELETVESRLRELEEIEREFEASGIETKQELNILVKKRDELAARNQRLKDQIDQSSQQIDQLLNELKFSAEMQARIQQMRAELVRTQERINVLLEEIEKGNQQYYTAKRRYDALDIEYAQLYEKFSEAEASGEQQ